MTSHDSPASCSWDAGVRFALPKALEAESTQVGKAQQWQYISLRFLDALQPEMSEK